MEHYVIKPAGEAGEAAVHAGLRAYNRTFVSDTADLSLVVEDEAGQIIGGCDARSEERRVGKECRSRWSPYH